MNTVLAQDQVTQVRKRLDRDIAASVAISIEDCGARAWQRGAPMWDHGFEPDGIYAAAWSRGWRRAAREFST